MSMGIDLSVRPVWDATSESVSPMLVEKVKETLDGGLPPLCEAALAARDDSAPGVWRGRPLLPGLVPPGMEEVSLASLGGAYFRLLTHEASSARCPPPHRAQRGG